MRKKQRNLRAILPRDLLKQYEDQVPQGQTLGNIYLASKHWKGSKKHMQQAYADASAIFAKIGSPHLFLTWTGNPNWPEIKGLLQQGQSFVNLPMHVTRIFWTKFEELMKDITERWVTR